MIYSNEIQDELYGVLEKFGLYVSVNYDKDLKPFWYIDQYWFDKRGAALAHAEKEDAEWTKNIAQY